MTQGRRPLHEDGGAQGSADWSIQNPARKDPVEGVRGGEQTNTQQEQNKPEQNSVPQQVPLHPGQRIYTHVLDSSGKLEV